MKKSKNKLAHDHLKDSFKIEQSDVTGTIFEKTEESEPEADVIRVGASQERDVISMLFSDEIAQSNLESLYTEMGTAFSESQAIEPPLDPLVLVRLVTRSSYLRPDIGLPGPHSCVYGPSRRLCAEGLPACLRWHGQMCLDHGTPDGPCAAGPAGGTGRSGPPCAVDAGSWAVCGPS